MLTDPIPLLGLMPDIEETRPGAIMDTEIDGVTTASYGFIPLSNGFGNLPGMVSVGASALAAECIGAAALILTGGSFRLIAGTAAKLYEISGTTVTDVSKIGGYTAGDNRWRFTAYGDYLYATDKTDAVQKSTGGNFADQATIPKCSYIDRVKDFVIIASTNEATYGDQGDRWWCSALGDPDDFTPSIATQCVTNRVTDSPGDITASKSLGDNWLLYKRGSMFMGTYQGPPLVWDFQRVSDFIGAWSHESVVKVGYSHYFIGPDDFYVFDGAVPRPIPNDVKNWFFDRLDKNYAHKIQGFYDRYRSIVFWFYPGPTNTAGEITNFVCVNLKRGTWGGGAARIEAIVEYISGGMTYDEFWPPSASTTWDAVPSISYDSPLFFGGQITMAAFDATHTLSVFTGETGDIGLQFTLADVGDEQQFSTLRRVIPHFTTLPDAASMYYAGRQILGDTVTFGAAVAMSRGRFDTMASSRWHRIALSAEESPGVIAAIRYDFEEDGEE
jgi:hypothetical protein